MAYATLADLRAYSADANAIVDDDVLTRELEQAERDIDTVLGSRGARDAETGLKVDPAAELAAGTLAQWQVDALNRATCAQAEYRLVMGPDFFIRAQHNRVRGPDFTTEGQLPYIGPKAMLELDGAGLQRPASASAALPSLVSPDPDEPPPIDIIA